MSVNLVSNSHLRNLCSTNTLSFAHVRAVTRVASDDHLARSSRHLLFSPVDTSSNSTYWHEGINSLERVLKIRLGRE